MSLYGQNNGCRRPHKTEKYVIFKACTSFKIKIMDNGFVVSFLFYYRCFLDKIAINIYYNKECSQNFFQDWWNSTSYAAYYRMWNVVVHDWLYQYVYKDCLLLFGNGYKSVAVILVFILSAIAHEYILILAFGFFFPVLFVLFGGVGRK